MRVLGEIPHPDYKITLFAWNGKYILKIEQGMLEQTYKISELDVITPEEVKTLLDTAFLSGVAGIFSTMHQSLDQALGRLNTFE